MDFPWLDHYVRRQERAERQDDLRSEQKRIGAGLFGEIERAQVTYDPLKTREQYCAGFECAHVVERFNEPVPIAGLKRKYCYNCLMVFIREANWRRKQETEQPRSKP